MPGGGGGGGMPGGGGGGVPGGGGGGGGVPGGGGGVVDTEPPEIGPPRRGGLGPDGTGTPHGETGLERTSRARAPFPLASAAPADRGGVPRSASPNLGET